MNGIIATQNICAMRGGIRDTNKHGCSRHKKKKKQVRRKKVQVRYANCMRAIMRVRVKENENEGKPKVLNEKMSTRQRPPGSRKKQTIDK